MASHNKIIPPTGPAFLRQLTSSMLGQARVGQVPTLELPSLKMRATLLVKEQSFFIVQDDQ